MSETAQRVPSGRAAWHRRTGLVPAGYLAAIVAAAVASPVIPETRWLLIHLLLLGAVTNAIVVWSSHFADAILRSRSVERRQAEATRLIALNAGILAVLAGGTSGPALLGVAGAAVVFAAVLAHLWAMAARLRRSLPARFAVTVHYYLAATVALLAGIPAGAWMLVLPDAARPRLLLFHANINLLGWVTLTMLGTLLTLWPTVLRTRMVAAAGRVTRLAFPLCVAGLALLAAGVLAWWPVLAAAGLALFGAAVVMHGWVGVATARQRPPASFTTWSMAAGMGWLLASLGWDGWILLGSGSAGAAADRFDTLVLPLAVGFVAQVLVGALAYLLPVVLGGGPALVRARTARLDRYWPQRLITANLALAALLLPGPSYLHLAGSALIGAAFVQFLAPALLMLFAR
jgi:hypothetical protein